MRHLCGETLFALLLILFAGICSAVKTSPAAPTAAFYPGYKYLPGTWVLAWRSNDASERILLADSDDGYNFEATYAPFGYSQKTFTTPQISYTSSPINGQQVLYLVWVDSSTHRIFISQRAPFSTIEWTTPGPINTVDTTSDTPWAIYAPSIDRSWLCIYFRGNTGTKIYYTCSETGLPGSFPKATAVTDQTTLFGPTVDNQYLQMGVPRNLISFRAADPSGKIFIIQADPNQNVIPSTLVQPLCCTSWSPVMRVAEQPGTGNRLAHVFWTDSTSRKMFFAVSVDNGINWSSPLQVNSVDTSKDQPAFAIGWGIACIYFISNDSTNTIRATCSNTGFAGSWPASTPV